VEGVLRHQIKFYRDFCEAKTWGNAICEGFINIIKEATNHTKWRPGLPILTDHRELDFTGIKEMPAKTCLASIEVIHKNKPGEVRIAVLLSTGAVETYAGLWQIISRHVGFPVEHKVFLDHEEALHWMMAKKGQETPYV
jgi:hypothetical protein